MSRVVSAVLFLQLAVLVCIAQQSAPSSQAPNQNEVHATIPVQLTKSLDAKKLKAGDEVIAKTSVPLQGNGVTIPSGSKVIGHVTQAQARSKGDPQSSLGIVFDKIELPGGKELPMQGYIQAIAPSPAPVPSAGPAGGDTIARQGPGDQGSTLPGPNSTLGGVRPNNPGSAPNQGAPNQGAPDQASTNQPPPYQPPLLNPNSQGVVGIKHLALGKDSVLTTNDKDLKLESGTQILVRTEAKQSAQSQ
jgi:hypothetical protein